VITGSLVPFAFVHPVATAAASKHL